jgi:hypothetical protein
MSCRAGHNVRCQLKRAMSSSLICDLRNLENDSGSPTKLPEHGLKGNQDSAKENAKNFEWRVKILHIN